MRRLFILFGVVLLAMAAGVWADLSFVHSANFDGRTQEVRSDRSADNIRIATAAAPRQTRDPRAGTVGAGRRHPPQGPAENLPNTEGASEQAAFKPATHVSTPAAPERHSLEPADISKQIASREPLRQVLVPLPPERPSPEAIREQNTLASSLFSDFKFPSVGSPRPIGFYSAGCLAGGEQLALQGPHWQVMRPSRNRNWGHPELIEFIERLADNVAKHSDWPGILVGDMAQPRGGPLPSGHASHQIGLDVDIWLHPMPAKPYTQAESDKVPMQSVVASDNKSLDAKLWQPSAATLIKLAAKAPEVERVFVNAAIKKELCRTKTENDTDWMPKVRPWYGHDDHMHVRLKCPVDSPWCREQAPIPDGDGCDKSLEQWFSKGNLAIEERLKTQAPVRRNVLVRDLPAACTALLHEPAKPRFATTGR